jgi:hypothetical protein
MDKNRTRLHTMEMPTGSVLAPLHEPTVNSAVRGIVDKALVFCTEQMHLSSPEKALESLRQGDRETRWYCHHSLGRQVAELLGDLDKTVKQVLVFDLEAPPEDLIFRELGPTLPVHLVVEVQLNTEALHELVDALEQAVVEEYASVVGYGKEERLIEIQVIDESDIEKRRGYVGLLGSLLNCPVQIWQR